MTHLYHLKRDPFRGSAILPLSHLKTAHPDLHQREAAKYRGRETLMAEMVHPLGCAWNDVVHLSPISPKLIFDALAALGYLAPHRREWWTIPIEIIRGKPSAWFRSRAYYPGETYEFAPTDYEVFDWSTYEELSVIPAQTLKYYRWCIARGDRPLLFNGIPHVLVKNAIDTAELGVQSE
jgi:hypothetical protein